ncbi:MAG: hypothetical protein A3F74_15885 [Betaproteobacteria bacterium RIFCSPLOWO2_12_FULL_62_58]|nr:MAG: hypothetical protein A3F74_15885 [Betaproteobacteria bacterium RIFCSPLOWO2_12_FULL_62_58]
MPLPHPTHHRGKEDEHRKRDADDGERIGGVMDDDLVDHNLGEHRRGQCHHLDRERGEQHVAPYRLVLEQLGDEPAEPESGLSAQCCIFPFQAGRRRRAQQDFAGKLFGKILQRCSDRRLPAALEV